jgi:hypothetical protein
MPNAEGSGEFGVEGFGRIWGWVILGHGILTFDFDGVAGGLVFYGGEGSEERRGVFVVFDSDEETEVVLVVGPEDGGGS